MAFERYKANVQALCDKRGIPNPIREEDLKIASITFLGRGTAKVWGTDMNRAGRLFVEEMLSRHPRSLPSYPRALWEAEAPTFFTEELWDDCGPEKRPLVYYLKTASHMVRVRYK